MEIPISMQESRCENVFPKELQHLIPKCEEDLNLSGVDRSGTGEPFWTLLQDTMERFFAKDFNRCIEKCQCLLDITWEKLNTGHWKDVPMTWRFAYSYVSLLKAFSEVTKGGTESAIVTCDMGLLMGAPILDNILSKVVTILQSIGATKDGTDETVQESFSHLNKRKTHEEVPCTKRHKKFNNFPEINTDCAVPRIQCPSVEYFRKNFMDLEKPVILEGCMDYWPAMSERKWTLDYIKRVAGCRTVPIEIGSKYTEETWSQKLLSVKDFIDQYIVSPKEGSDVGYLAQHQLFDQIPELRRDISIPTYCCLGENEDVNVNAWFGPQGTISPLHQDPKHNFLAQVMGEKYIKLYPVEDTDFVYPHSETLLHNTSQVDVENPDLVKFPNFCKARLLECVLGPGEMLYIPKKHWHYVRSLSVSFSVSFWWE